MALDSTRRRNIKKSRIDLEDQFADDSARRHDDRDRARPVLNEPVRTECLSGDDRGEAHAETDQNPVSEITSDERIGATDDE